MWRGMNAHVLNSSDLTDGKNISIAKYAFLFLSKFICNNTLSLESKKKLLKYYGILVLFYGSESWSISSQMKKKIEATECVFYGRIVRTVKEHVINREVLEQMDSKGI